MKKNTIKEAVLEILKKSKSPMTSKEIYNAIVSNKLYEFKTKTPQSIVNAEIRKNCDGVNLKSASSNKKLFKIDGEKYSIIS